MRTNEFADQIKGRLDILQVFEYYGFTPNRGGFVICPSNFPTALSLRQKLCSLHKALAFRDQFSSHTPRFR